MISLSAALKAHFQQPYQTISTLWLVTLVDAEVRGFTDHDQDIVFNGTTFKASTGFTRTDIAGYDDLSVDNMELDGIITSPSITEDDLRAGIWDYAAVKISQVNWSDFVSFLAVTSISRTGGVATVTTTVPLPSWLTGSGYSVLIQGAIPSDYNGFFQISVTGASTFTYPIAGTPSTPAVGTIQYQPTMGEMILKTGKLGEVTLERNTFKAEIRGEAQAYSRTIGELTSAGCRAELGDARCKVPMNPAIWVVLTTYAAVTIGDAALGSIVSPTVYNGRMFICKIAGISGASEPSWNLTVGGLTVDGAVTWTTIYARTVTGTLTGVNPDQLTMYDTARLEPGPTGGIAITGVSNSNPGHITMATGAGFFNFEPVTLSGIIGPSLLNSDTIIRNLSGNVFDLGINTSNTGIYPPYVSGGFVTPLGGNSGYFDFGKMTMTSGAAIGLSMEVRSYVPKQWILQLPFADGLLTPVLGDTYTMTRGCDKSLSTCITAFSNVMNMRAEPYLPGIDKIIQIGKP